MVCALTICPTHKENGAKRLLLWSTAVSFNPIHHLPLYFVFLPPSAFCSEQHIAKEEALMAGREGRQERAPKATEEAKRDTPAGANFLALAGRLACRTKVKTKIVNCPAFALGTWKEEKT
ncbi:unnamed protein product [Eretmochelys imbricata]